MARVTVPLLMFLRTLLVPLLVVNTDVSTRAIHDGFVRCVDAHTHFPRVSLAHDRSVQSEMKRPLY
jgi:hypothetical protein